MADPDEVAEGSVMAVEAGPRTIALTRLEGQYGALDGRCPHQGGPLAEGTLEEGHLRCPWHGWGFHPRTGESAEPHHEGVTAYDVDVREDGIHLAVAAWSQTVLPTSNHAELMTLALKHAIVARESMGGIVALAEQLGAPVLTTFKGKGQIPDDHPLAAGVLGRSGTAIASGPGSSHPVRQRRRRFRTVHG